MKTFDKLDPTAKYLRLTSHVILSCLLLCVLAGLAAAQSKDERNPTPLTSPEISGVADPKTGFEAYYAFIGGPGKVEVILEIQNPKPMGGLDSTGLSLIGEERLYILLRSLNEPRGIVTFPNRKQNMLLHVQIGPNTVGSGQFRLRISGDVEFGKLTPSVSSSSAPSTSAGSVSAPSTNKNSPTVLTSPEVSGVSKESSGIDYYYTFLAGPGELVFKMTVSSPDSSLVFAFDLEDEESKPILLYGENPDKGSRGVFLHAVQSEKTGAARANLPRKQRVRLHITTPLSTERAGSYRLQLSGAVDFGKGAMTSLESKVDKSVSSVQATTARSSVENKVDKPDGAIQANSTKPSPTGASSGKGRIVFRQNIYGHIYINGQRLCDIAPGSPCSTSLSAGTHSILIKSVMGPDYQDRPDMKFNVTVTAGQTTELK